MDQEIKMKIDGRDYVAIPLDEYRRLKRPSSTGVDALAFADAVIAANLRAAREAGGLTQAELAAKLDKSQVLISRAESGKTKVGVRYAVAVLAACGLPKDWTAPPRAPLRPARRPSAARP